MKFPAPLLTLGLLCSTLVEAGKFHPHTKRSVDNELLRGGYIVEFTHDTAVKNSMHGSLVSTMGVMGHNMAVRQQYDSEVFSGISVTCQTEAALHDIINNPNVVNVWPIVHYKRPEIIKVETHNNNPDFYFAHNLTGVHEVHNTLRIYGKGVKVGVIDTGIDYTHPALGGAFGLGHKVAYGYDLVGDNFDGVHAYPDKDPLDKCIGHGTHVAGIIIGNDTSKVHNLNIFYHVTNLVQSVTYPNFTKGFIGVAPQATLGVWRIFGCNSSTTTNDIIIKAMEMAHEAGMDIINLSLGEIGGWEENPVSIMADRLVGLGRSLVIAEGNDGSAGILLAAAPATGRRVIAAASFDNLALIANCLDVSTLPGDVIAYLTAGAPPILSNVSLIAVSDTTAVEDDGCNPITKDIKGKIALIKRGICTFLIKATNAQNAGAVGVIIYTKDGQPPIAPVIDATIKIPVVGIANVDGVKIFNTLSKGPKVTFGRSTVKVPIPSAGTVSDFSSWGPTNELQLKPNLGGIGGGVYSTLLNGSYGTLSGTSMASPYIAGSIALLLEALGQKHDPEIMTEIFQNYAKPAPIYGTNLTNNPICQGAGLIHVLDAIKGTAHVSPAELSFNDTAHHVRTKTITITNKGRKQTIFHFDHLPSAAGAGYDVAKSRFTPVEPGSYNKAAAEVKFSETFVTLEPGKSIKVQVSVFPPKSNHTDHLIYGGYLVVRPCDADQKPIHVPYIGMVGNMHDLPIFDKNYPVIQNTDGSLVNPETNVTYTLADPDYPKVVLRLLTGTTHVMLDIINLPSKTVLGSLPFDPIYGNTYNFLPRNTIYDLQEYSQNYTWPWTGYVIPGGGTSPVPVPNGVYHISVSALKVFGDAKMPTDWVKWLSPPLVIKRL
ncbi:peptidase S8/S53 domain-containing protein [Jimgerdemannia flammicorona]|uniref:Peptidase S8/S53 domain-containing protein n=1 Tax=Jimgerdemannia flammicorona TaxID=994334 RepID=A0A433QTE6_9FUNG|nr:peptidase S8/S53 domain-containing protein [Jimgerdemannia flammicorona]